LLAWSGGMAKGKINITAIERLRAGETLWDTAVVGFGARRQLSAVAYVIKYRHRGQQRFVTIGQHGRLTPDQARKEARRLLGLVAGGSDPGAAKIEAERSAAETVGKVAENYLKVASKTQRPRSFNETQRHLRINWAPLHSMPVAEVRRRHIAEQVADLASAKGLVTAARARSALSAAFNWAIREGLEITTNPVLGTNRPAEPASRSHVLSDAELRAIWHACDGDDYGRIVRLLLLTGQRRDEVGGMRWAEIDLDRKIWVLPSARTKNHREHRLPLSGMAVAALPKPAGIEEVFGERRSWSRSKAALDVRCGVRGWRLHDLRRSCATVMADRLGVLPHIIEAVLNHVSGHRAGVAGIYNRARYEVEMRAALDRWSAHIETITGAVSETSPIKPK
jgi:integrase